MLYIKELQRLDKPELINNFMEGCSLDLKYSEEVIDSLLNQKILRLDSMGYYYFDFVGLLIVKDTIVIIYPKYIHGSDITTNAMKKILNVVQKYSEEFYSDSSQDNDILDTKLGLFLSIIHDFENNGLYANHVRQISLNGDGEILWNLTIEEQNPIFINEIPYYLDLKTESVVQDDDNLFKKLHKIIVTECYKKLLDCGVSDFFEMNYVELSSESLENLGEESILIYEIEKELVSQYSDNKKRTLSLMIAYLEHKLEGINEHLSLDLYGTTSFNIVWEKICSEIFGNQKDLRIKDTVQKRDIIKSAGLEKESYSSIIDKINWSIDDLNFFSESTFIPDIVKVFNINGKEYFGILDAKYYAPKLAENRYNNLPGITDVSKQYMYELAYDEFINLYPFEEVINMFIVPLDNDSLIVDKYSARLDVFSYKGFRDIQVIQLNAEMAMDLYLKNRKIDKAIIEEKINEI